MKHAEKVKSFKFNYYQQLKWNIVAFTLIVVCIPLPLVAGTIYKYYKTYVRSTVMNHLKSVVEKRNAAIQVFLAERLSYLKTLSRIGCLRDAGDQQELEHLFPIVKTESPSFVDMGVINERGIQLVYVGPYDLLGKNYQDTVWFQEVFEKGVYISDVFLGFRNVPHLAIAVRGGGKDSSWFLRATTDGEQSNGRGKRYLYLQQWSSRRCG
ncbi:MAG: cache domain-containing protein [Deltaproteobacteria bacterium]|nr:cache domain-containing protein [Deltaproteobacteria bacterium]MBW2018993.1 cache domain-containing protein [Deltaproteobacteria bacterium]MBW2073583.1 cache domain-containing protein [Deltaproteobacteria bacterium]RLB82702.1 MAG: hypothetical protein DRH17_04890 [Deltaproteobacteria bacterium]